MWLVLASSLVSLGSLPLLCLRLPIPRQVLVLSGPCPLWPVLLPRLPSCSPTNLPSLPQTSGLGPAPGSLHLLFLLHGLPALTAVYSSNSALAPMPPLERSCLTACLPLPLPLVPGHPFISSSNYLYLQWYLFFSNPLPKMKTSDSTLCCLPLYPCAESAVWHLKVSGIFVD